MTHVLYLSAVTSPAQFQAVEDAKRPNARSITYGMPQSGQKFGWLIQSGLAGAPSTRVTALSGRAVNPRFHTGVYWRRVRERIKPNWVIDHLGFPNARVLRQVWLAGQFAIQAFIWRWRTRREPNRVFLSDGAYITALPGLLLALRGSNVKTIAIFADIYNYMGAVQDATGKSGRLFRMLRAMASRTYAQLDGFILLTEQMNAVVNPGGKPHLVMEGLVDASLSTPDATQQVKAAMPTALYAGALRAEYGLANLIEGFRALGDPNARLIIYGDGDYAAEVRAAATLDPRIDYRGNVPVDEVVENERSAWLLVNPRPADQEFTRYSFPSKNMEYLASGTAVLTTRLPGMPDEYLDYVLTIDQPGASGITTALEDALGRGVAELSQLGARGQRFVLDQKNNDRQAARILAFAEAL